jgi:aryl-phospho-beta-D-glucosidase BglC (GH1 family)
LSLACITTRAKPSLLSSGIKVRIAYKVELDVRYATHPMVSCCCSRTIPCSTQQAAAAKQQRALATCSTSASWTSAGGKILLNGQQFNVKGINWFGLETDLNALHGLWGSVTLDSAFDFMRSNKINAVRIPISLDLALALQTPSGNCVECAGRPVADMLDVIFDKAASKGIVILLDMHTLQRVSVRKK